MTSEPDFGVVFGCPRSGTTFVLRALNAAPATVCLNGIIFPAAIPQILNQPVPEPVRAALGVELKESLLRYLRSGLFHARATALQKWKSARTGPGALWDALRGQQAVERLTTPSPAPPSSTSTATGGTAPTPSPARTTSSPTRS